MYSCTLLLRFAFTLHLLWVRFKERRANASLDEKDKEKEDKPKKKKWRLWRKERNGDDKRPTINPVYAAIASNGVVTFRGQN